ncbi:Protein KTI12 [Nakaseomyces bracarensis]|uniref:Protein KTI12 n=2 Tax=Nakaseomyces bracarensis TaxID=273131 RepID=A0ABR4NVU3_9SACH
MPLVLLCGYPLSGKSTVASKLADYLKSKNCNVTLHTDKSVGYTHDDYRESLDERKLRNEIISVVRRDLSRNNIVVIDSLNYIKGFRYQLHCEAKNMNTSFLLIHCVSPYNAIVERNNSSNSWDQSLIDQLIQRFEEPNDSNRWDSPCITILTTESDDILAHQKDIDDILITSNSGASKKINKLSQNNPTVLKAATSSNFIQVLDATLTDTIKKIIQEVSNGTSQRIILSENRDINEPGCIYLDIPPQAQITLPRLNRLKRQFIQLNKNLRDVDQERIVPLFVAYLDQTFASEY